jgi:hypothetical protein
MFSFYEQILSIYNLTEPIVKGQVRVEETPSTFLTINLIMVSGRYSRVQKKDATNWRGG